MLPFVGTHSSLTKSVVMSVAVKKWELFFNCLVWSKKSIDVGGDSVDFREDLVCQKT